MTIRQEETAMNTSTSISEYASVETDTGLTVPTPSTTPTTMKAAATTEVAKSQRQAPTRIGRAQLQAIAERLDTTDRELLALLAAPRSATTRQPAPRKPRYVKEQTHFADRFKTPVEVRTNRRGSGQIVISFQDHADFERISKLLG